MKNVSIEVAFKGAVEMLRADLTRDAFSCSLELRAAELISIGVGVALKSNKLVILARGNANSVAFIFGDAERPWLYEVLSGDLESDACPGRN